MSNQKNLIAALILISITITAEIWRNGKDSQSLITILALAAIIIGIEIWKNNLRNRGDQ